MASEVRLRDGTRGLTWALLPEDREELAEGYERLSPESQFHRFLTGTPRLTEALLDHLVDDVDGIDHVALVLFLLDDEGVGTPVGVTRMIRYPDDPSSADVAVTVAEEFRGRGAASALLSQLLVERPRGVVRIRTTVAADNPASLAMLERLGPTTVAASGNLLDVVVELRPAPA